MRVAVIIAAGGYGRRFGRKKQFLKLGNQSLLMVTLQKFLKTVSEIVLVVNREDQTKVRNLVKSFKKVIAIAPAGRERQDSVYNGLQKISPDTDIVLVHDAARPLVSQELIRKAIAGAKKFGAVVIGVPVKDTIKKIKNPRLRRGFGGQEKSRIKNIVGTLERSQLWAAQTPQAFRYGIIKGAYEWAKKKGIRATDDAQLVERMGKRVRMIEGSHKNIKITTPEDLRFAEGLLNKK